MPSLLSLLRLSLRAVINSISYKTGMVRSWPQAPVTCTQALTFAQAGGQRHAPLTLF